MTRVERCSNGDCRNVAKRYAYGPFGANRRIALLCDECRDHLLEVGMDLRSERRADPNRPDRNHAPWLGHARDMGAVA